MSVNRKVTVPRGNPAIPRDRMATAPRTSNPDGDFSLACASVREWAARSRPGKTKLLLELCDRGCILAVHRHVDEHLEPETDRGWIDDGAVSADDAIAFQPTQPPMARRNTLDPVVPAATANRLGGARPQQAVRAVGARQLGGLRGSQHDECDEHGERRHPERGAGRHLATA